MKEKKRKKKFSSTKTPINDTALTTGCHMTSQAAFINRFHAADSPDTWLKSVCGPSSPDRIPRNYLPRTTFSN